MSKKKNNKRKNNDLQNITHKTKDRLTRTPLKTENDTFPQIDTTVPITQTEMFQYLNKIALRIMVRIDFKKQILKYDRYKCIREQMS